MNSLTTTNNDLAWQLRRLGLQATAQELDDLIARATKQKWSPLQLVEAIARSESADRAARNLQRRLQQARLGRFKPIADFDWEWPKKIDRELVERALKLNFIEERRNLILMGANGLGKTCITKNIAYQAVTAGKSIGTLTVFDPGEPAKKPVSGVSVTFANNHTTGQAILYGLQSDAAPWRRRLFGRGNLAQFASAAGGDCNPSSASVYIEKA